MGATRVVAVDINQARLDFARSNGFASQTYCSSAIPADKAKTTDEQLRRAKETAHLVLAEFKAPEGFDVVFECTGAEPVIQMSVHVSLFPIVFLRLAELFRYLLDCHHRWQGGAHWNGYTQRHAPPL